MIGHERENPTFTYDLFAEKQALRTTKRHRDVPDTSFDTLLAATWNLTNFGVQKRSDNDIALMADHLLVRFSRHSRGI